MKILFSSPNAPEVSLLKGLLEEGGISCELRNESIYPNMPGAAFQPEVWVSEEDYARACEVLDAWRQTVPVEGSREAMAGIEASRSDALFRGLGGLVMIAGAVWLALSLRRVEVVVAASILFAVPGTVLLWSAVAQLRESRRNRPTRL